jgi:hypothetical protein
MIRIRRPGVDGRKQSSAFLSADRLATPNWQNAGMISLGGVVSGTYHRTTVFTTLSPIGAQSTFTASINSTGAITVTAHTGTIAVGQTVIDGSGNVAGVIASGSGNSWQMDHAYYGAYASQSFSGLADDTSAIQTALNSCTAGQVVQLNAGTFIIGSAGGGSKLMMPSNVTLRGAGAGTTILYKPNGGWRRTSTPVAGTNGILTPLSPDPAYDNFPVVMFAPSTFPGPDESTAQLIVSDSAQGTNTVTVPNASIYTVGQYLILDELSGATYQAVPNGFGCAQNLTPTPCPPLVWAGDRVVWNIHYPHQIFQADDNFTDANAPYDASVLTFTCSSIAGNAMVTTGSPALVPGMRLFGAGLANPTSVIIGSGNAWTVIPPQTISGPVTVSAYDYAGATYGFSRPDRATAEMKRISAINGNVITFESPATITYRVSHGAQVTGFSVGLSSFPFITLSGVEELTCRGGGNGNIRFNCASYCWARNVECTEWINENFAQINTYRIEIRDSYSHTASGPTPCGGGYSFSLANAASESLIENNIILDANKVIVCRSAGAGSVFAYNYGDNGWISYDTTYVEVCWNASHLNGSHHVLMEGNIGFNCDSDYTHGNSIYVTHFRNHYTGQRRDFTDSGAQRCAGGATWSYYDSFVGNVLGYSTKPSWIWSGGISATSVANGWAITDASMGCDVNGGNCVDGGASATWSGNTIWRIGFDPERTSQVPDLASLATAVRDGNYDFVSGAQHWYNTPGTFAIPNSMYLTGGVPWFFSTPAAVSFPPIDPANPGNGSAITNPALTRYNAGTPNAPGI